MRNGTSVSSVRRRDSLFRILLSSSYAKRIVVKFCRFDNVPRSIRIIQIGVRSCRFIFVRTFSVRFRGWTYFYSGCRYDTAPFRILIVCFPRKFVPFFWYIFVRRPFFRECVLEYIFSTTHFVLYQIMCEIIRSQQFWHFQK